MADKIKFVKEVLETTRGIQPTKWDDLIDEFKVPGDTLFFDQHDVSRAGASQCAKRMMVIDKLNRKFHSGFHVIKNQTFVRVRPDGEIPSKENSMEQGELDVE